MVTRANDGKRGRREMFDGRRCQQRRRIGSDETGMRSKTPIYLGSAVSGSGVTRYSWRLTKK